MNNNNNNNHHYISRQNLSKNSIPNSRLRDVGDSGAVSFIQRRPRYLQIEEGITAGMLEYVSFGKYSNKQAYTEIIIPESVRNYMQDYMSKVEKGGWVCFYFTNDVLKKEFGVQITSPMFSCSVIIDPSRTYEDYESLVNRLIFSTFFIVPALVTIPMLTSLLLYHRKSFHTCSTESLIPKLKSSL